MPGISFLFKKRFHPARSSNQKRVFIAEQTVADRHRAEEERGQQILRESEEQMMSSLQGQSSSSSSSAKSSSSSSSSSDPRSSGLHFMYNQPKSEKKGLQSTQPEIYLGDRDDDMVRAFRQKISNATSNLTTIGEEIIKNQGSEDEYEETDALNSAVEEEARLRKLKSDPNFGASAHRSKLEIETGKRRKVGLTQEEQAERFPCLKNAPVEGAFAKNIEIRHKPFNEVIRNVQCVRCGEYGHQSGDRECPLRDSNPHELARKRREDPLTYMQSDDFLLEKQKMVLRFAAADREPSSTTDGKSAEGMKTSSASSSSISAGKIIGKGVVDLTVLSSVVSMKERTGGENNRLSSSTSLSANASRPSKLTGGGPKGTTGSLITECEEEDSDPERDFIASLTAREKKLLLRKLRALETPMGSEPHSDAPELFGIQNNQRKKNAESGSDSSDSDRGDD